MSSEKIESIKGVIVASEMCKNLDKEMLESLRNDTTKECYALRRITGEYKTELPISILTGKREIKSFKDILNCSK